MRSVFLLVLLLAAIAVQHSEQSVVRTAETETTDDAKIAGVSTDPNDVAFYLYPNSGNVLDYDQLIFNNINSIRSSRYNPLKRLIIYSSGFMQNFTTDQAIKDAYVSTGFSSEANIIVVDWGKLSGNRATIPGFGAELFILNLYNEVKKNVPVVGQRVFEFIRFLESNGQLQVGAAGVHIVGQSMGAHVGGAVGLSYRKEAGNLIGRITGTDAAGPSFQGINKDNRLDASDATFVDSLHTNDGGYGYSGAFATADFFVNGGKAPQPGCDGSETFCSHNMAVSFYAKSIIDRSIRATSTSDSSSIPFGEYCPNSASGSYNVNTTPDY